MQRNAWLDVHKLPPEPDPNLLPQNASAPDLARIHWYYWGPIAPRTIRERWPLKWRNINRKAVASTSDFVREAKRRYDAAPTREPI
jgi:hypothetical protein